MNRDYRLWLAYVEPAHWLNRFRLKKRTKKNVSGRVEKHLKISCYGGCSGVIITNHFRSFVSLEYTTGDIFSNKLQNKILLLVRKKI